MATTITTTEPLPRLKHETEGLSSYTTTDPPSFETRVGGVIFFFQFTTPDPTLARNARWRGHFLFSIFTTPDPSLARNARRGGSFSFFNIHYTRPLPRSKCETEVLSPYTTTDPPSLETRVGHPFSIFATPDPSLARNARWRVFFSTPTPPLALLLTTSGLPRARNNRLPTPTPSRCHIARLLLTLISKFINDITK